MKRSAHSRLQRASLAWQVALGVLLLGLVPALAQASVSAHVDRNSVMVGEPFVLSLTRDAAATLSQPDLAPLAPDFAVLGTSTSREVRFVNGHESGLTRWQIQLQPRHAGALQIPPLSIGSEQTPPIALNVALAAAPAMTSRATPGVAAAGDHAFVEVEAPASGHSIYLQQQTPLTVRLYYDDTLRSGELSAPQAENAVIEPLGAEQRSTVQRLGRTYHVVERRYAVSPQKSGNLRIAPVRFEGQAELPDDGSGAAAPGEADDDPFAKLLRHTPFANDPFLRNHLRGLQMGEATHAVTAQGTFVAFAVKPRPATAGSGPWLPAEQITLHDSWQDDPPQARAGEPLSRVITIQAKGLAGAQLPPLTLPDPAGARVYPEVPKTESHTDGVTIDGSSTLKLAYIPDAAGTLQVQAIEVPWWNTLTDHAEVARIAARSLVVAPGAGGAQPAAAAPGVTQPAARPATRPAAAVAAPARPADATPPQRGRVAGLAAAVGALVLVLVLAAALFVAAHRRRARSAVATAQPLPQRRSCLQALKHACQTNDAHAARQAVLALAAIEWPDDPPRGLGALAARLKAGRDEVLALERCLYGNAGTTWNGAALWQPLRSGLQVDGSRAATPDEAELAALYR